MKNIHKTVSLNCKKIKKMCAVEIYCTIKDKEEKMIYQFIKEVVIGYAIPKIKGKITNGKLKWRGIVVNMTRDYPKKIWITQRGRKLYKSLVLDRNYTISEPIGNINIKNGEICKLEEITIN